MQSLKLTLSFIVLSATVFAQVATSTTAVNSATTIMPNSKLLLGITMDSRTGMTGTSGQIGYFNTNGTLLSAVDPLFSDFPLTSVRYPANGILYGFDWKKSIGKPASGRAKQNLLGGMGPAQAVQFGFDEFMAWTEAKGLPAADVQIMVSIYDSATTWPDPIMQSQALPNVAQHCADWVEYANSPNDGKNPGGGTDWAAVRAANGHPNPYGIKIWNMGNEPWADHEFGKTVSGCNSYLTTISPIIDSMLTRDPSIKITLATVGTSVNQTTWHYTILNSSLVASGKIYGVSPHAFPVESGANNKVSNFISIYSNLAAQAKLKNLKIILGDYAHGILQTQPTQAEQDIAMQWQGTTLNVDFLLGMSKTDNVERVGFWAYGMPVAQWHPIRKLNGVYTLMPAAQIYKDLHPLLLDKSISTTNTSRAGSDGNSYSLNAGAFTNSDGSKLNIIAVNRDLTNTETYQVSGVSGYTLSSAELITASGPTAESYSKASTSADTYGMFSVPPSSILILQFVATATARITVISNSIQIFPNPCDELFYINASEELKNGEVIISDELGKIVASFSSITGKQVGFTSENLSNGVYFIQINDAGKQIYQGKLIVQ